MFGLDFVAEMPPEGALHLGLAYGALFSETFKRIVRRASDYRQERKNRRRPPEGN
jgi:hypothetical protein